jgi:hypothetical protein
MWSRHILILHLLSILKIYEVIIQQVDKDISY